MRRLLATLTIVALLVAAGPVCADSASQGRAKQSEGYGSQLGWGMAALGANLGYVPAKLVYALLGGVTGGLVYILTVGNSDVVERVWAPALGGTYVLSSDMLRGDDPIYFSGENLD